MKSNEVLSCEAIKLFNDYKELIKNNPKQLEDIFYKLFEIITNHEKYTEDESKIIFGKFMILVLGQELGGNNVSV